MSGDPEGMDEISNALAARLVALGGIGERTARQKAAQDLAAWGALHGRDRRQRRHRKDTPRSSSFSTPGSALTFTFARPTRSPNAPRSDRIAPIRSPR